LVRNEGIQPDKEEEEPNLGGAGKGEGERNEKIYIKTLKNALS
jgi:hypothetical protein